MSTEIFERWQPDAAIPLVEGSLWLGWLREESGGVLEEFELTHYAIYTNQCRSVSAQGIEII